MNFLENLSKKTAEATEKVAQKTKDLSEIARLNGLVVQPKAKSKTYTTISANSTWSVTSMTRRPNLQIRLTLSKNSAKT